jgi:hypothetical protein
MICFLLSLQEIDGQLSEVTSLGECPGNPVLAPINLTRVSHSPSNLLRPLILTQRTWKPCRCASQRFSSSTCHRPVY